MKKALFLSLLFLLACSSTHNITDNSSTFGSEVAPAVYAVEQGDTLFSIAWRFGLDQQSIMRNNAISNPNKIFVGQRLRLLNVSKGTEEALKASAKKSIPTTDHKIPVNYADWVWPMKGHLLKRFSAGKVGANGIRIAGTPNQTVNAAEGGIVAYKGSGLRGYGNVVIIKHNNGLLSAYGFLSKTYVKEGQQIKRRQKIGTVGYGSNNQLMLHYEVRRGGQPVNPLHYIGNKYHF